MRFRRLADSRVSRRGCTENDQSRAVDWSAFTSVLNDPAATAVSTMSWSAVAVPMVAAAPVMAIAAMSPAIIIIFFFIACAPCSSCGLTN